MIKFYSVYELAAWLRAAKTAHEMHERANGPDPDWPMWYAEYMARQTQRVDSVLGRSE